MIGDAAATAALRERMKAEGLPVDVPEPRPAIVEVHHHDHSHPEYATLTEEERLVVALSGRCCS